jgi:hypothetical protein
MKALLTALLALSLTACLEQPSTAPAASPAPKIADPAPPAEEQPPTSSALAGTYRNGSFSIDILADGSFTLATQQVVRMRVGAAPWSAGPYPTYACNVTGSIGQLVYSSEFWDVYSLSITSSNYYNPSIPGWQFISFGCLGKANPTQLMIKETSPGCLKIQSAGELDINAPTDEGLTYCK